MKTVQAARTFISDMIDDGYARRLPSVGQEAPHQALTLITAGVGADLRGHGTDSNAPPAQSAATLRPGLIPQTGTVPEWSGAVAPPFQDIPIGTTAIRAFETLRDPHRAERTSPSGRTARPC